jgi:hypothetical protein
MACPLEWQTTAAIKPLPSSIGSELFDALDDAIDNRFIGFRVEENCLPGRNLQSVGTEAKVGSVSQPSVDGMIHHLHSLFEQLPDLALVS